MTLKIIYFASLREKIGRGHDELKINEPKTVADIWTQATGEATLPDHVLMAINHVYVDAHTMVQPDDEVAFFPPVTGG